MSETTKRKPLIEGKIDRAHPRSDKCPFPLAFSHRRVRHPTAKRTAVLLTVAVLAAATWAADLRVNLTESLPPGVYRAVAADFRPGALVSVCLPDDLAALAKERGYGKPGPCPGGIAPLLKRIAAMPGDTVVVSNAGLAVNGEPIPRTARRERDSHGRPIPRIAEGDYAVSEGELWLVANHRARSWDSRYFGPLEPARIIAGMRPVVTWSD